MEVEAERAEARNRFVDGIMKGLSAAASVKDAGIDPNDKSLGVVGEDLLKDPEVRLILTLRRMDLASRANVDEERVMREVAASAFLDIGEIAGEDITCPEDLAKLPEHVRRAISGWKYDRFGNFVPTFSPKSAALETLAKMLGMFQKDRQNERDDPDNLMSQPFWRYVYARHITMGISIAEAEGHARRNPDEVLEWAKTTGLLKSGEIVVEPGQDL